LKFEIHWSFVSYTASKRPLFPERKTASMMRMFSTASSTP
jgi:hypothetical protein